MTIKKRTANDGNVILEGVPEIPERLVEQLNRYQNVRSAEFECWTEDGSGIYVKTRFGEVHQLHLVKMPGGARHQLTYLPEPARGFQRQPGGSLLTFLMDEGGSELYQIHLYDPASGSSRRLSDGHSRHGYPRWSPDGRRIAYLSTRRDGRSNDVWVMHVDDPSSARMVVEAPDGYIWSPGDWSGDGSRLLIHNFVSVNDSRLHLLDPATGEMRIVAGGDATASTRRPSTNTAALFDASGRGIFFLTDQKSEFTQLAHLDLETGAIEILTRELCWNVTGTAEREDRSLIAFLTNENGISRLYLMDTASRLYRPVEDVPIGVISSMDFDPSGQRLALTLSNAKTPNDVFTFEVGPDVDHAGEDLVRWTFSEVGGLDTDRFIEPEAHYYPTFDQVDGAPRQVPAFVYKPEGEGPHPVIVSIHGGPEGQARPGFNSVYQQLIAHLGTAVVAPNVRGSSGYGKEYIQLDNGYLREDSVKDIGALLDWIATQDDLDEERVVVLGGSYGGYMVLASLVHYSDRLLAGVDVVGISNFVTFLENTKDYRRDLRRMKYGDERDPEMRAFLERISPNNNAKKITAPLLVIQGHNDPRVPVTEAEQIVRDVRAAGYDVWYMDALNEGHGFGRKENRDLFIQIVVLFLEKHLKT